MKLPWVLKGFVSLLCVPPPKCKILTDFLPRSRRDENRLSQRSVGLGQGPWTEFTMKGMHVQVPARTFASKLNIIKCSALDVITCPHSALTFHTLFPFYRAECSECLQNAIVQFSRPSKNRYFGKKSKFVLLQWKMREEGWKTLKFLQFFMKQHCPLLSSIFNLVPLPRLFLILN